MLDGPNEGRLMLMTQPKRLDLSAKLSDRFKLDAIEAASALFSHQRYGVLEVAITHRGGDLQTKTRRRTMTYSHTPSREAPAHALALIVTASGRLDDRALAALDRRHAFEHLAVDRARFVELAHASAGDVGDQLHDCSWLRENHLTSINERLDAVLDASKRRLVCGLALAAITADGEFTHDERLVYDHALARWHLSRDDVARTSLSL